MADRRLLASAILRIDPFDESGSALMASVSFVVKTVAAVAISGHVPPMIGGGNGGTPVVFEPFYVSVVESMGPGPSANSRIIGSFVAGDIKDVNQSNFSVVVVLRPGNYTIGKDLTKDGASQGDIFVTSVSGNRPTGLSNISIINP